jgi:hypothetical protein
VRAVNERVLTPGGTSVPVVAIVGCSPELVTRCREVGRELLVLVLDCTLETLQSSAGSARPCLILVQKSVCDSAPEIFRAIAAECDARVLTVLDELPSRQAIEAVLSKAARDGEPHPT